MEYNIDPTYLYSQWMCFTLNTTHFSVNAAIQVYGIAYKSDITYMYVTRKPSTFHNKKERGMVCNCENSEVISPKVQ